MMKHCTHMILICLICGCSSVWAFGANGHRIVAAIAENHLSEASREAIHRITHGSKLVQLANWPDTIKSDPQWDRAKRWHFINLAEGEQLTDAALHRNDNLLYALRRFNAELADHSLSETKRWQALAFLVHFVADIHQPLHVGRHRDRGGNRLAVMWFGKSSNLHRVWDSDMIEGQKLSYSEYVAFIDRRDPLYIARWQKGSFADWAEESRALLKTVYDFDTVSKKTGKPRLGYAYVYKNRPIIERQLLKAGIRLAGCLNRIFEPRRQ